MILCFGFCKIRCNEANEGVSDAVIIIYSNYITVTGEIKYIWYTWYSDVIEIAKSNEIGDFFLILICHSIRTVGF